MTRDEYNLIALLGIAALENPALSPRLRAEIVELLDRTMPDWRGVAHVLSDIRDIREGR